MTIPVQDPVRPLDPSAPPRPEDVAVGDRRSLPASRDELRGSPGMRAPARSSSDEVRESLRPRHSKGKTSFELASQGASAG
jgi:hypothetical protein